MRSFACTLYPQIIPQTLKLVAAFLLCPLNAANEPKMMQDKQHYSQCDFRLGNLRMDTNKLISSVAPTQRMYMEQKCAWLEWYIIGWNFHKTAATLCRIFFLFCFQKKQKFKEQAYSKPICTIRCKHIPNQFPKTRTFSNSTYLHQHN